MGNVRTRLRYDIKLLTALKQTLLRGFPQESIGREIIFLSKPLLDPTVGLLCLYCPSEDSELGS
jgi:hypothetical protein